jgi:NitT/TauT family transport system permease protein
MPSTIDASVAEQVEEITALQAPTRSERASGDGRISAIVLPIVVVLAILAIWEILSKTETVNPLVLPAPSDVAKSFWDLLGDASFWKAAKVTAWETIAGLLIGVAGAWILGTLIGLNRIARRSLYPLVICFQVLPRVALAPLFLVWFGFGLTPRIMFAVTICFFPVVLSVIVGLQTVDPAAATLMRSFGASRWQVYRRLALPASLPIMFAGIKTAATLALIGAIVGEFVGGDQGLGVLISTFNNQLEMANAFATIVALAIFGLALYGVVDLIDKRIVFWRDPTNS